MVFATSDWPDTRRQGGILLLPLYYYYYDYVVRGARPLFAASLFLSYKPPETHPYKSTRIYYNIETRVLPHSVFIVRPVHGKSRSRVTRVFTVTSTFEYSLIFFTDLKKKNTPSKWYAQRCTRVLKTINCAIPGVVYVREKYVSVQANGRTGSMRKTQLFSYIFNLILRRYDTMRINRLFSYSLCVSYLLIINIIRCS